MSELYCWNHISLNKSQSGKKRIISRTLWFTFWRLAACYVSYDSSRIKGRCCYLFVNAGFFISVDITSLCLWLHKASPGHQGQTKSDHRKEWEENGGGRWLFSLLSSQGFHHLVLSVLVFHSESSIWVFIPIKIGN